MLWVVDSDSRQKKKWIWHMTQISYVCKYTDNFNLLSLPGLFHGSIDPHLPIQPVVRMVQYLSLPTRRNLY